MTNKSKRTHPLDRDGDGEPGGSLQGNQTAPMATDAEAEQAKLEAMERETDEANAAVRLAAGWTRDDARLTGKLTDIGARFADLSTEAVVESWTDQEVFNVEAFADAMLAPGRHRNEDGDEVTAEGVAIPMPDVLAAWEIDFEPDPASEPELFETTDDDTFDAEQVEAAGQATAGVIVSAPWGDDVSPEQVREQLEQRAKEAWGERPFLITTKGDTLVATLTEAELVEAAAATAPADPIAIDDVERQVAVRLRELRILLGARRLYKSADGYSASFGAPFIDQATVDAWLAAGLADAVPSAGNQGGVRATAKARQALVALFALVEE